MKSDAIAYPPRGLSREEAARYVGVSVTKFDEMVIDRRMPKPRKVDQRNVWDRHQLDAAFSELPWSGGNELDRLVESGARVLAAGEKIIR